MKYKALVLLLFLFVGIVSAQKNYYIKMAPLGLLDGYSGSALRVGIEHELNRKWSLYHEVGSYFPRFAAFRRNTGIILKNELKWYFNDKERQYFSVELMYKYQDYHTSDSVYVLSLYRVDYAVSKNAECITFKCGGMTELPSGLVFDFFVGLGVRFKQVHNSLSADENAHIKGIGDYSTNVVASMAGNFVSPNVDIGVKIGYRLK